MKRYVKALHTGLCCGNWYTKIFRTIYQFPIFLIVLSPIVATLFFQTEIDAFFDQLPGSRSIVGFVYFWCIGLLIMITLIADEIEDRENQVKWPVFNADIESDLSEKDGL